ncbi:hypothetical protein T4C_9863, partial [Trichinella pseudospiralis]
MLRLDTLRLALTESIFCYGVFCQINSSSRTQIVYILTEFRMSSISNAVEAVFTATCAVSDFYANKGGFKIKRRRIEDGREGPEDD